MQSTQVHNNCAVVISCVFISDIIFISIINYMNVHIIINYCVYLLSINEVFFKE